MTLRRKLTLSLYPTAKQEATLCAWLELHRLLYNAALQERISAWDKAKLSVSYNAQQNMLPQLKKDMPELIPLGSQALQATLKRLDLAMSAFYRRCAAGETPGFPRFKSMKRFHSFSYPSPAGWSYLPLDKEPGRGENSRSAWLRLGDLLVRARGMSRFASFTPNDLTIQRVRPGVWKASITLRVSEADCQRERTGGEIRGFDQGLTDRLTFDDGETVENTRLLRSKLSELAGLQRRRALCTKGSRQFKRLNRCVAKLHRKVANQRHDENHKLSATLVRQCSILATEALDVAGMVRAPKAKPELDAKGAPTGEFLPNGAAAKAGLNRELQSAGMGFLLQALAYKAEEAGTRWHVANTRKLKPTQRCACCGGVAKKKLDEREHSCACGFQTTRDRNAALVCLIDALWPTYYAVLTAKKPFVQQDGFASFIANRLFYANLEYQSRNSGSVGPGAWDVRRDWAKSPIETPTKTLRSA